jgi:hypothetical protein
VPFAPVDRLVLRQSGGKEVYQPGSPGGIRTRDLSLERAAS